ncbi:MAG: SnoaL-like domain [Candidatus Binatota bacterium]|jgi:ketosteroid isomerase-like protein|nr:SnoaL-like domain [Candidatus Binatota bacterium]
MSKETAVRYFENLKTHDAAKVAETFHPNISSWDPLAGSAQGKETVTAVFAQLFQQMPDVVFEPKKYVIDGNRGAVEWVWTATLPNGKLTIPGMDLMEFEDGLIRSIKFYYDPTPLKG